MNINEVKDQVSVLWPYLSFKERYDWAQRIGAISNTPWNEVVSEMTKRVDDHSESW